MNDLHSLHPDQSLTTEQMVELQKSPILGTVIGKRMTTDRWADFPLPFWRVIWNWACGRGWHLYECRLMTPRDKGYNPEPYEQTLIW